MSHLKSRFNKFVRDRSIKAHGRGHRRLSEPAAQRRQGQNRKCICGKKRTYKRRSSASRSCSTATHSGGAAAPPPRTRKSRPGETAAAAGDEPEPDPRMMGLRAAGGAGGAKKLRERATVIAAKGRKNKQGVIPAAVMGMLYDFVEECDLERARDVGLFPRTALPRKDLDTPRLNHKDVRSLGTGLPPVSSFPLAGASLLNIDFALVPGVDIKCGHCGSRAVCVTGNTARSKDRLGVVVLHRPMQPPIYACSAIQTCDDCKKTTRHDDPAVLAKLGPCDDMLLPCEHEQCVGTRQHRATREFVDLVSSATAFSDAGWETVSREHSEALAVRRSRNHLSFASCLADYTATLEAYVGDDVELDDDERDARSAAREALDGVQWCVAQGRSWVAAYDDSSTAAGGDLSADIIRDMWLKGAKSLKTFRIREQQDVKLGKDDVLSYDGCPRLGNDSRTPSPRAPRLGSRRQGRGALLPHHAG
ncbi:hypothetical protein JL722_10835 [Aureococcus anophagefferens]|nr:hypothetical protein JL722_10835 [Aureococcus anophagefferens]